ncbi:MAG: TetR/AcrR family transcriptional regulator [Chloroflexota bacterium]|nr:TetR/AcrR family transcriptional regulator [Chloroflexota bacterium]
MASARDQIVETTCDLLDLQGYHATGLNEIVRASGSPKGSLYYYFPGGKEELTEKALEHVGGIVRERIERHLKSEPAPGKAICSFIRLVAINVEASGYKSGGPITTVALETAATSDRLRATCERIYASWQRLFKLKLEAGGLQSEQAEALATLTLASLEGGILLCRTQRSPKPLQQIADTLQVHIEHLTKSTAP